MAFKVQLVEEVEFDFDGEIFKIREPSLDEYLAYLKKVKELEDESKIEELLNTTKEFLNQLGFPEKYHSRMKLSSLRDVIEQLAGQKKS
jgi:tRNA C32,U32 (ribose-2'-O)-methylase TrmJ